MNSFYTYDKSNGRIIEYGFSNMGIYDHDNPEYKTVPSEGLDNITDFYHDISSNTLVERPVIEFADSVSVIVDEIITIENVENGTDVFLNNDNIGTIEDGRLEISIPLIGDYEIRLDPPFPYKRKTISVEVS